MSPHTETYQRTLVAIDFMLGYAGGYIPIDVETPDKTERLWHRTGTADSGPALARRVQSLDERLSPDIRFGLPMVKPDAGGVNGSTVLWAVVEGSKQIRFAAGFRPLPTLALRVGGSSRRYLLWLLRDRLDFFEVKAANRKLAYRFRGVQKHGDPDGLRLPAPGTCVRAGRSRPAPVQVTRVSGENFKAHEIVGRLKAPPEFDLGRVLAAK